MFLGEVTMQGQTAASADLHPLPDDQSQPDDGSKPPGGVKPDVQRRRKKRPSPERESGDRKIQKVSVPVTTQVAQVSPHWRQRCILIVH